MQATVKILGLWKGGGTNSMAAVLLYGAFPCPARAARLRSKQGRAWNLQPLLQHGNCSPPSLPCMFRCSMLWALTRAASNAGVHCLCMLGPADEAATAG